MDLRVLTLSLMSLVGGCLFSPTVGEGAFACGDGGSCPPGFSCASNGRCNRSKGEVPDAAHVDLARADLHYVDLAHIDLAHIDLHHVDLAQVDLAHVDLASPCGKCLAPATCGGGQIPTQCGCTPQTCGNRNCGMATNGCGGMLDCGKPDCKGGGGPPGTCGGGGGPNICGSSSCAPKTCQQQGKNCGVVSDGCSDVTMCPKCGAPQVCGGSGTANVCG